MSDIDWPAIVQSGVLLILGGALTAGGTYLSDRRQAGQERTQRVELRKQALEDEARDHLKAIYHMCQGITEEYDFRFHDHDDLANDKRVAEIRRLSGLLPGAETRSRIVDGVYILSHWDQFAEYPERDYTEGMELARVVGAMQEVVAAKLRGEEVQRSALATLDDRMRWHGEVNPF